MTQLVANSLVFASVIVLVALGFSQLYQIARFFNFAHGGVFTCAAYMNLLCIESFALPPWVSVSVAVCCASLLAGLVDRTIYRPLRQRRATSLALLLASLGVYVVLESAIALSFGSEIRIVPGYQTASVVGVFGARITSIQLMTIGIALAAIVGEALLLRWTPFGRMIRAIACDPFLGKAMGLLPQRLILLVTLLGSTLVAFGGILYSMDIGLRPGMGLRPLLLAVVAALVGGTATVSGVVAAAAAIGVTLSLGAWFLGTHWADAIIFIALLGFLLVRSRDASRAQGS